VFRLETLFDEGELDGPVASDGYTGPFSTYDKSKGGLVTRQYESPPGGGLILLDVFFKGDGPWTYVM